MYLISYLFLIYVVLNAKLLEQLVIRLKFKIRSSNLDIKNISKEQLERLSPEERKIALEILKQYANKGSSDIFNNLVYNDYEEIPVDIETFLTNDNYMGQAWKDAEGKLKIYPY